MKKFLKNRIILLIVLCLFYIPILIIPILILTVLSGGITGFPSFPSFNNIILTIVYLIVFIFFLVINFWYLYFLYKIVISIITKSETIKEVAIKKYKKGFLWTIFVFILCIIFISVFLRTLMSIQIQKTINKINSDYKNEPKHEIQIKENIYGYK